MVRGEVEITDSFNGPGAPPRLLVRLGEGQCFGEMALVFDTPRAASVRASASGSAGSSSAGCECAYLERWDLKNSMTGPEFQTVLNDLAREREARRERRCARAHARTRSKQRIQKKKKKKHARCVQFTFVQVVLFMPRRATKKKGGVEVCVCVGGGGIF